MNAFSLEDFLPRERKTPFETWERSATGEFYTRIESEFGIPWDARIPNIPYASEKGAISLLQPATTLMCVPGDSVNRLKNADDILSVFFDIVAETHSNLTEAGYDFVTATNEVWSEDLDYSVQNCIEWTLSKHAIHPFRGSIKDPQEIFSSNVDHPERQRGSGSQTEAPTSTRSITIEKVVNNPTGMLARDIVEYDIDNPNQVFGSTYGIDFQLMIRRILNSNLEPAAVDYCVEFEGEIKDADEVGIFTGL